MGDKTMRFSTFILFVTLLMIQMFATVSVVSTGLLPASAQEKEIPIIIEETDNSSRNDTSSPGRTVEIIRNEDKQKQSRKTAKIVRRGSSVEKLVRTFKKYCSHIDVAENYYDSSHENFRPEESARLKSDLTKWKKMRIKAKAMKRNNDPEFEEMYTKIKDFEKQIGVAYGHDSLNTTKTAVVETIDETLEKKDSASDEIQTEIVAQTETGQRLLENLKKRAQGDVQENISDNAEDMVSEDLAKEKQTANKRLKQIRTEREGGKFHPSNIRWSPRRVTYNKIQPDSKAASSFTLRNRGKYPFEGAIVPIESWITVTPPTVYLEPRSEIDIDVIITAPGRKKARIEGSIEIRSVGESSRRIPIVVRTVRR
jgi:hypothetical protein